MDTDKPTDAIESLKKTLELDPENKQASFNIGVCLFNTKNYEKTIKVFQAYQKQFGVNFEAERYISLSFYSLNNLEDAEKSLKLLCNIKPQIKVLVR